MKPSELSAELESAKKRATTFHASKWSCIAIIIVAFQVAPYWLHNWFPEYNFWVFWAALGGVLFTITGWEIVRARDVVFQAQKLATSGNFVGAATLLMNRLGFSTSQITEPLARVLLAWADERMKVEAWTDAKNILVAIRTTLSRGYDLPSLTIDEARCLAAIGELQEAKALLIVAQSQAHDALTKDRASRELTALTAE